MVAANLNPNELQKVKGLDKAFKWFAENENSATWISCSIAVFKGIFRPTFTMMDKTQDPETKKYAAIREGLTEVAALPLYAATPYLVGKAVDKFYKGANKKNAKMNGKFLGICAATLIIPAVCNIIQPPIMKAYKRSQDAKKAQMTQPNPPVTPVNKPLQTTFSGRHNYGMKVGG